MAERTDHNEVHINHPRLLQRYAELATESSNISPELFQQYGVKRGLRNADGSGVLIGLTNVGSVIGFMVEEQDKIPTEGRLIYRGIEMPEIVKGCQSEGRAGFEETTFLLLFGRLPTASELTEFMELLDSVRGLPANFKEDAILHLPSPDVMNKLARCILAAYSYDENADDLSTANTLRQCIELIARFPTFVAYGYHAKAHYFGNNSLFLHNPPQGKSTAEVLLSLLRQDSSYTPLEAQLLDLCLILHAEHGGGNNSSFTTHVVASTNTDTYSVIAAAVLSLKGPRHGGANLKVSRMMEHILASVKDPANEGEVADCINKILAKKTFDGSGLIYGLGHAVYTLSDPRATILREQAERLAKEKGATDLFRFYSLVERLGSDLFMKSRGLKSGLCANVDFYSGLVYQLLDIPVELYTPLFAVSRVSGWCAHRMEELISGVKIVRPACKSIAPRRAYVPLAER